MRTDARLSSLFEKFKSNPDAVALCRARDIVPQAPAPRDDRGEPAAKARASSHRLRLVRALSLGMPIQVVVPSVSLAETLQGAALTGARGASCSGSGAAIGG
jgi:hypothetical protein